MEEINEELTSCDAQNTESVVRAVDNLVEANSTMQQQLASAEARMQEQAQEIASQLAQARTDALTGLANRRAFDNEMAKRLKEFRGDGRCFSMAMIDVDHFKKFNDTYGHQAGDEVLRGVARTLADNARDGDLVARYGGEEFAVVYRGTSVGEARTCTERTRQKVEEARFQFAGRSLKVTASMGVAEIVPREDVASIVERADAALYAAKGAGRNCVHWHDGTTVHPVRSQPGPEPKEPAKEPAPTAGDQPEDSSAAVAADLADRTVFCSVLANRLAEWRRGGNAPAALLVEINRYEDLVARHGPAAGQTILRAVTQFLSAATREMDLVARYGDCTFSMLLPGASATRAIGVAERLRNAIAQCRLSLGGTKSQFTVSLAGAGAVVGDTPERLMKRAEEALEAANNSGGNSTYFHNGRWSEIASAALERIR